VVVGYTAEDEGEYIPGDITLGQENALAPADDHLPEPLREQLADSRKRRQFSIGGDRTDLGIHAGQQALVHAAAESGKPVIVVIVAGSAVLVDEWHERAGAILQSFYSGQEGGTALARLLFGDVSPSGRLPFTVARRAEDYPFLDIAATAITYDRWHGYAKFAHEGIAPRYAFGHGLSYTSFACRAAKARVTPDAVEVSVAVTNTGSAFSESPVLFHVAPPGRAVERWPTFLKAFARVALAPGETRVVRASIRRADLRYRDPATHRWLEEPGEHGLRADCGGASAESRFVL
jgi:beta-glucosidase